MSETKTKSGLLLRCEWRDVVALNFEVDERFLVPHIPTGTRLAKHNNHTLLTLMATHTREIQPHGRSLTLFRSVRSIDLRFYVCCDVPSGVATGHVIMRQVISKRMATGLMRWLFGQPCRTNRISHTARNFDNTHRDSRPAAEWRWGPRGTENHFSVKAGSPGHKPAPESREDFVLQQHFRFAATPRGAIAWQIRQAPWIVWNASSGSYECDRAGFMDAGFGRHVGKPHSVFMTSGGEVRIHRSVPVSEL